MKVVGLGLVLVGGVDNGGLEGAEILSRCCPYVLDI